MKPLPLWSTTRFWGRWRTQRHSPFGTPSAYDLEKQVVRVIAYAQELKAMEVRKGIPAADMLRVNRKAAR